MNVHIFNPEHDLALAANSIFWTSPHAGRQLRADLGWLPALWAVDGDVVVVDDVAMAENACRKLGRLAHNVKFVTMPALNKIGDVDRVMPWGWDRSIVHQLSKAGVPADLLYDENILNRQREISDRATSSRLLAAMTSEIPGTVGESVSVDSMNELQKKCTEWGRIVVKSPWSSSGRGVKYAEGNLEDITKWCEKVLRTQGHIMVERYLDKIKDFGMEFYACPEGSIRYEGLSLFSTSKTAYEGSILATENEKTNVLAQYIDSQLLFDIQYFIQEWMKQEINGTYVGPFGVDMMLSKQGVNPCVEINLRRTMGHVALSISPSEPGKQQIMRIGYEGTNYHFRLVNDHEILV